VFLELSCDGTRIPAELSTAGGKRRIALRGRELACDWVVLPNGRYSIILGGRVYDVGVDVQGETCSVDAGGDSYLLHLLDLRRLRPGRNHETGPPGVQEVTAVMSGMVSRVLVREGEAVEYAQGLLVLEAMKMQNEVRSPKRGMVKRIGVAEGKTVKTGEFLISLE
jgi:acetyl/propionyl-CoA carboxylase alpha subunit